LPDESVDGTSGLPESELPRPGSNRTVTPAVAVALVLLAAAFVVSVAFILANGGLDLPAAASQPGRSGELATPGPTPTSTGAASLTPSSSSTGATPGPSSPRLVAIATPGAAAPRPAATPSPPSEPRPRPSSDRYDLLTACPDTPDCWIYVIRRGDNLASIANYFGVSLRAVEKRNPWTTTSGLAVGGTLLLPTPGR
jgi:hypothetical protein